MLLWCTILSVQLILLIDEHRGTDWVIVVLIELSTDVTMVYRENGRVDANNWSCARRCDEKETAIAKASTRELRSGFLNVCLNCTSAEYRYLYRIFEVWSVSAWRRRAATARRAAVTRADRQDLGGDGNNGREIWYAGTRAKYRSAWSRWTRKRKFRCLVYMYPYTWHVSMEGPSDITKYSVLQWYSQDD